MRLILMLIFFVVITSCQNSDYIKAYKVKSPDKTKCITFLGEYDKDGVLKNHRFYLLGYENANLDRLPDTNFILFDFYGEMEFVLVKWEGDLIRVIGDKPIQNKLEKHSKILFSQDYFSENESNKNFNKIWFRYWFKDIHQEVFSNEY